MNSQNKEQAIKAAYGELYEELKKDINEDGVFVGDTDKLSDDLFREWDFIASAKPINGGKLISGSRPKELRGIETNRGWTRIESEEDMPKDKTIDVIINDECYQGYIYEGQGGLFCCVENRYNSTEIAEIIEASSVTHYQPIETPKPPIF